MIFSILVKANVYLFFSNHSNVRSMFIRTNFYSFILLQPGFYWNNTGSNCLPCNCGIGTELTRTLTQLTECDMNTGQCKCAPHVVGRDCTECELGYFGVSENGCKRKC